MNMTLLSAIMLYGAIMLTCLSVGRYQKPILSDSLSENTSRLLKIGGLLLGLLGLALNIGVYGWSVGLAIAIGMSSLLASLLIGIMAYHPQWLAVLSPIMVGFVIMLISGL